MAVLELRGVEKRFGGLPALGGVDLEVRQREILAVIGPNGAGKSTLLKAISGLQPPTAGMVRFRGEDIAGLPPHLIRRRGIAKVLQRPRVFPSMSVRDNVVIGAVFGSRTARPTPATARRQAEDALELVGLAAQADIGVGDLNLHQQRMVELARALAGRPEVLLLDEVMAGLNPSELQTAIAVVRTARDRFGVTVVWVEHVMQAVTALADRVFVLSFGRRLADGPPHEVMRHPDVVAAYLGEGTAGQGSTRAAG